MLCALAILGNAGTYTVRSGDTLSRIARTLGVTQGALADANDIKDHNKIRIGQVLKVPDKKVPDMPAVDGADAASDQEVARAPADPVSPPANPTLSRYVVRKGDKLSTIAKQMGTTVAELMRLNDLKNPNMIRIGQVLVVPIQPVEVTTIEGLCPVKGAKRYDISDNWRALRAGHLHMGNDIFARRGVPVVANIGGELTYANGSRAGLAYYLVADDGHTYYGAHLGTFHVEPGRVEQGQQIGTVGNTGNARTTPPHLHFEIKPLGGASTNPHHALVTWCR